MGYAGGSNPNDAASPLLKRPATHHDPRCAGILPLRVRASASAVVLPARVKAVTPLPVHDLEGYMSDQAVAGRRSSPSSWPVQSETPVGLDVTQPVPSLYPEKFIPVDRSDIVERSLERLFERGQRELAAEVARYMCALRQAESARILDELVSLYDPFNPDDETVNLTEISPAEKRVQLELLKEKVIALVTSANFNVIDQAALKKNLRTRIQYWLSRRSRPCRV